MKEERAELVAMRKRAKDSAPLLLAIVKDLAFGIDATADEKVQNARNMLRATHLETYEEGRRAPRLVDLSDAVAFYPENA